MKMRVIVALCLLVLWAGSALTAAAADQPLPVDTSKELKEMPVLTGDVWLKLHQDTKLAFIWGVCHVVTIEQHVVKKHPDLAKPDFPTKLAEGLDGVLMNSIVAQIDTFYHNNPDDLDVPVMSVLWGQIVRPRLTTGIDNRPINKEQQY